MQGFEKSEGEKKDAFHTLQFKEAIDMDKQ